MQEHKLTEATSLVNTIHTDYYQLQEENTQLRIQLQELKDVLFISRNLIFDGDAYWLISDGQKLGPFCQRCYHTHGSLIRLHVEDTDSIMENWSCSQCNTCITPTMPTDKAPAPRKRATIIPFVQ